MTLKRIAVIAGDGIGKEVMPEGLRVMEAAASKFNRVYQGVLSSRCVCALVLAELAWCAAFTTAPSAEAL